MQRQLLDLLELASGRKFDLPETLEIDIHPALAEIAARLLPPGPVYVGIAPGSGGKPKCWPLENFIALAREQAAKGRTPVFLLGPQEVDWFAGLRDGVPEALFPLQAEGVEEAHHFSPLVTIALSKQLAVAVSNDSGVGHMLAVGGAPLVSLFGRTMPEKFMPMARRLTILRAQDFGGRELRFIPLDAVSEAVEKELLVHRL